MAFDIAGARKAGYTDDEIKTFLSERFDVDGATTAGYSLDEIAESFDTPKSPTSTPPPRLPVAPPPTYTGRPDFGRDTGTAPAQQVMPVDFGRDVGSATAPKMLEPAAAPRDIEQEIDDLIDLASAPDRNTPAGILRAMQPNAKDPSRQTGHASALLAIRPDAVDPSQASTLQAKPVTEAQARAKDVQAKKITLDKADTILAQKRSAINLDDSKQVEDFNRLAAKRNKLSASMVDDVDVIKASESKIADIVKTEYRNSPVRDAVDRQQVYDWDISKALNSGSVSTAIDFLNLKDMLTGGNSREKIQALKYEFEKAQSENPETAKTMVGKIINDTARMLPAMGAGIAASVIPGGGAAFWISQGIGSTYDMLRDAGISHKDAQSMSVPAGIAYGLVERLQVGQITKTGAEAARGSFLKLLKEKGADYIQENVEEVIQQLVQDGAVVAAKGQNGAANIDDLKKMGVNTWETLKATLGPMGILTAFGVGAGAAKVVADKRAAKSVEVADGQNVETLPAPTVTPTELQPEPQKTITSLDEQLSLMPEQEPQTTAQMEPQPSAEVTPETDRPPYKMGSIEVPGVRVDGLTEIPDNTFSKGYVKRAASEGKDHIFQFDIDNFKALNDVHGHDTGDDVLKAAGRLIQERFGDKPHGREGGEEFFVGGLTEQDLPRIQEFLKEFSDVIRVDAEPVTISGGFAKGVIPDAKGKTRTQADKLNYDAKESGRNRVAYIDKDGNLSYIDGREIPEGKKYVRAHDRILAVQAIERRLSDGLEAFTPEDRSTLERAVSVIKRRPDPERSGDISGKTDNATEVAPTQTPEPAPAPAQDQTPTPALAPQAEPAPVETPEILAPATTEPTATEPVIDSAHEGYTIPAESLQLGDVIYVKGEKHAVIKITDKRVTLQDGTKKSVEIDDYIPHITPETGTDNIVFRGEEKIPAKQVDGKTQAEEDMFEQTLRGIGREAKDIVPDAPAAEGVLTREKLEKLINSKPNVRVMEDQALAQKEWQATGTKEDFNGWLIKKAEAEGIKIPAWRKQLFMKESPVLSAIKEGVEPASTNVLPLVKNAEAEFGAALQKHIGKDFRGKIRYHLSSSYYLRDRSGKPAKTERFNPDETAMISISPDGNADIFINPSAKPHQVASIFAHEIRHYGLAAMKAANPKLGEKIYSLYREDWHSEFTEKLRNAYDGANEDLLAEEWLVARLGEMDKMDALSAAERNIIQRLWAAIKQHFNDMLIRSGMKEPKTREEVLRDLQGQMRRLRETADAQPESDGVLFSKDTGEQEPVFLPSGRLSETARDIFVRKIQDQFLQLKRYQQAPGAKITEESNAYLMEELSKGKVESRLREIEKDYVDPLTKAVAEKKIDLDDFQDFLYAKHASERNEHIARINEKFGAETGLPGSGMFATAKDKQGALLKSPDDESIQNIRVAEEIIDNVKAAGNLEAYEDLAKLVYKLNDASVSVRLEAGLIDKETAKNWRQYKNYVPLRGLPDAMAGEDAETARVGKGFSIRGPESKRAAGRKSEAQDILAHSILQAQEAIIRSEKNKVGQSFLKFVKDNPNPALWEIDKVKYVPTFDKTTGMVEYRPDNMAATRDDAMSVKVGGETSVITIKDPILARAMKNLGAESQGKIVQAMGSINRYLSIVNTSLVPDFVLSNFTRDLQTTMVNIGVEHDAKMAAKIIKDVRKSISGAWSAIRDKKDTEWSKWYKEFQQAGGKIGFFGFENVETIQKKLMDEVKVMKGGSPAVAIKAYRAIFGTINDINSAVENGVRLSTYVNMRKAGHSKMASASVAKNVTVNFNRKGEWGTGINAIYMFSNASIQGTAKVVKILKTKQGKTLAAAAAATSLAIAEMMRLWGGRDDDDEYFYDKIPSWIKQNNIIIMHPGTGKFEKIPIPYGYNVFWAMGQAISRSAHSQSSVDGAAMIAGSIADSFNPLGSSSSLLQTITPTQARWLVDLALNKNFFGSPIMKEDKFKEMSRASQSYKGTSEAAKKIAESISAVTGGEKFRRGESTLLPGIGIGPGIDISPDALDYMVEYATGGAGRTISQAANVVASIGSGNGLPPVGKIPFVRRFAGEVEPFQDVSAYYDNIKDFEATDNQVKFLRTTDPGKAAQYMADHKNVLALRGNIKSAQNKMKILRNKLEKAEAAGYKPMVDAVNKEIYAHAKRFNRIYNSVKDRGAR